VVMVVVTVVVVVVLVIVVVPVVVVPVVVVAVVVGGTALVGQTVAPPQQQTRSFWPFARSGWSATAPHSVVTPVLMKPQNLYRWL